MQVHIPEALELTARHQEVLEQPGPLVVLVTEVNLRQAEKGQEYSRRLQAGHTSGVTMREGPSKSFPGYP